ncbi:LytR/AlgR family response regulator transcription factor [Acinetobacter baumannii]|nr:response regulator transcription factor [Acinetobacter baumannii]
MKVLICDDEPLAVERLSRLVSKMGHEVVAAAHHGQDALEQARLHHPDVILLDIQMPGMNGLVCAEQLSQLNPRPAIVFCTAYDQHALEAFKSQAQAYLLKPIDPQELEQTFKQLTQLTQAQLSALPKPELLQDLKTQRHQIAAKTYRGVELIPVENIYYFLADQFIRIHRNALVSITYLDGLELVSSGQYQVRLRGLDERLSVSRRHLSTLRERIHQL